TPATPPARSFCCAGAVPAALLSFPTRRSSDLCQVANAVGTLAASDTAAGAFFRFRNGAAFTVDTVTPAVGDTCFTATVTGMTTTNNTAAPFSNDIDLAPTPGCASPPQPDNART